MSYCCLFVPSRVGYRAMTDEAEEEEERVMVVVGKERRVFFVEPFVLGMVPLKDLIELGRKDGSFSREGCAGEKAIFVDVDAILFEHLLWLLYNDDCSSLFQLDLKEIVEFYSQDS
ncbi:hypothetical protein QJS10_CPB12g01320 [Acorus calamus]|uniref:Potassium channel tetramerisation-type BTB domain-containing protein n=1 Tax=Acorus calamus TaxID=4465 RepID=A0AAV9DK36_ACOCL|nr:hypothetical protein QJS10_CPB12g01320 [Acorus calamus]